MLNDVMLTRRGALTALSSSAATLVLSACSSSNDDEDSSIPTSVEYSMWDSGQQPAYQACADRFKEKTGITVNITQAGWNDYWTKLTAGFIAGTGPDAFADHIQKFAQLVDLDVLLPLEEQAAWADVDVSAFQEGLLELWKGEDGHQYGCPKDWDTEAIFYNKDMAPSAGLSQEDMAGLEWNPDDGGTFERLRAVLDELGIDVPLIGLAKRLEEVWVPGEEFPVILPRTSPALYLLQHLRDESHRFAITHHRKKRSAGMTRSVLDGTPGLGPARQAALLREFGSVARIRQADVDDITRVKGIGPALAGSILAHLNSPATEQ